MKLKHIIMYSLFVSFLLAGCRNSGWTTTTEEFDLKEAKAIHRAAWEPVYQMVNEENIITPTIKVKSFDEFMVEYGFDNMTAEAVKDYVFSSLINGDANDPKKDSDGYIIFGNEQTIVTADNLINDDIYIDQAYIEIRKWEEADIIETKLVIVERSRPGKTKTDDFERLNYFKKNVDGEWILTNISGNGISIYIYNPEGVNKN